MKFSSKVEACGYSPVRKFNSYQVACKKAGKKIYHLNIGQPDIKTPEVYMEAVRSFDSPVLAYVSVTLLVLLAATGGFLGGMAVMENRQKREREERLEKLLSQSNVTVSTNALIDATATTNTPPAAVSMAPSRWIVIQ